MTNPASNNSVCPFPLTMADGSWFALSDAEDIVKVKSMTFSNSLYRIEE